MKSALSLTDVMQILRRGEPCTITVCTFDLKRNKGGDRKEWHEVRLLQSDNPGEEISGKPSEELKKATGRNPNHTRHMTVNVRLQNDDVMKIHVPLIEKINGQRVAI